MTDDFSLLDEALSELLGGAPKKEKPKQTKPQTPGPSIVEATTPSTGLPDIDLDFAGKKISFSTIEELVHAENEAEKKPWIERPKKLLKEYGDVKIYEVYGEEVPVYYISSVRSLNASEQRIFKEAKEACIRNIEIKKEDYVSEKRREEIRTKIKEIVKEVAKKFAIPEDSPTIDRLTKIIMSEIIGFGMLEFLLKDDLLEEVMVIGTNKPVYVFHREFGMCKTNIIFRTDKEIINIARRIAYFVDRRIDQQCPILDARLADGSRVNAVIPPIALEGPHITIRKFKKNPLTIIDLIKFGTMSPEVAAFLWLIVDGMFAYPANIIVAGGTGSGKTTTLNILGCFIPVERRIISIEDVAELQLPLKHWIREETRPKSIEGTGEITMDDLLKAALRQRPDAILVGEIRGSEAKTLFTAMNTGHQGCMGTVHANSARETIIRLKSPPMNVPTIMLTALNFIVMQQRILYKGRFVRRISEIAELAGMEGDTPRLNIVYRWHAEDDEIVRTDVAIHFLEELTRYTGLSTNEILDELEERKEFIEYLVKKAEDEKMDVYKVGKYIQVYGKLKKKELARR